MGEFMKTYKRKNNKKKPLVSEEKAVKRLTTSKQCDTINLPQFKNIKVKRGENFHVLF